MQTEGAAVSDELLTIEQLAEYLQIPVRTIHDWRHRRGGGPRAVKVGRHLRYRMSDVQAWLESKASERTTKTG
jgi:excisionase family DNA binding protein